MSIRAWLDRLRNPPACENCPPDDQPSAAERHFEEARVMAERKMRWAAIITKEIEDRPSWEQLLVKDHRP